MKEPTKREQDLQGQIEELRLRLQEAEDTLRAIREGEVDAVIVSGSKGEQVFSLVGAESIYRLIVETMKEAAFTVTFDGRILYCNGQFGEFVKRPLELIVGHPLREFVAEPSQAAAASFLLAAQRQPVKQRLVFQDLNCTNVPAHVSANVLNQPDGMSICVVATDLTELENSTELIQQLRRQREALQAANEELSAAEEELRVQNEALAASRAELDKSRARYQDLFETAPDGYVVTDREGTIQEANEAATRLLGRPAAELKGNPLASFLSPDHRQSYLQRLAALSAGTTPLPRWEAEICPRQGLRFWAAVTAATSRNDGGGNVGLRWLLRDVTERKRTEEALLRKSDELQQTNSQLAHFNRQMVGRELRMIELKKEIDALCQQFGQPTRYGYGDGKAVDSGGAERIP
jgi:PAS domain S-box-containing protein